MGNVHGLSVYFCEDGFVGNFDQLDFYFSKRADNGKCVDREEA